jgi:hypothetical protein
MADAYRVAAPFESRSHLVIFLVATFAMLSLPFLNAWLLRASAADVFRSVPPRYENYRFMGNAIARGGDVDVLIIGGSDAWTGFDTHVLIEELSLALGRPAKVLNFGANWYGAEAYFARVQDALSNLKAKVVVVTDTFGEMTYPHQLAKYWWLYPDNAVPASLTLPEKATLYASSLLGAPRRLWADLHGARNLEVTPRFQYSAAEMERTLGFNGVRLGWLYKSTNESQRAKYIEQARPRTEIPVGRFFYRNAEDDAFTFFFEDYTAYQTAFLKQTDRIVRERAGIFAMISVPVLVQGKLGDKALMRRLWNGEQRTWPEFGVPTGTLFAGLSDEEAHAFYYNEDHLNMSGAKLYSRTIVPALAKLVTDAEKR